MNWSNACECVVLLFILTRRTFAKISTWFFLSLRLSALSHFVSINPSVEQNFVCFNFARLALPFSQTFVLLCFFFAIVNVDDNCDDDDNNNNIIGQHKTHIIACDTYEKETRKCLGNGDGSVQRSPLSLFQVVQTATSYYNLNCVDGRVCCDKRTRKLFAFVSFSARTHTHTRTQFD